VGENITGFTADSDGADLKIFPSELLKVKSYTPHFLANQGRWTS